MSLTKASYSMITGAPVNVLDYGADPTGSADSSAAINAAVDTGRSVYIPKGVYRLTAAITPSSQQSIYGEGPKQTILRADTVGMNVIDYPSGTYSNIEIYDLGIDGNSKAQYGLSVYGSSLFSGSVSFCKFSRLEAGDCTEAAFYFRGITGCSIDDIASINGTGLVSSVANYAVFFEACFNSSVNNCIFSSGNISTVGVSGGTQLTFNNVYVYNNGGGADSLMFVDGGFGHSFVDCGFETQNAGGTIVAAVELKQTSALAERQCADINFVRCRWVGLAGTTPYNIAVGTVGTSYKLKLNECQFIKPTVNSSIALIGQAYTSITNCMDMVGYYDLSNTPVSVTNTSGNPYFQENLSGRFSTPVVSTVVIGESYVATGAAQIAWLANSGSPEGVVIAPVGSLYSRTNGGAGTSFYVKESGTGNTGWVAK